MKRQNKKITQEGHNIYLRPMRISDANKEYAQWLNDPEVNKYLESRFTKSTTRSVREYIKQVIQNHNIKFFAIVIKKTHKHIGNIKLVIDWHHQFGDIGIMIGDKNSWGHGYGSEALQLLTRFAFKELQLHKLIAGAYENNIGSIKIFKKNGFFVEGIQKKQYVSDGKYVDSVLMAQFAHRRQL